jgi:hypothetical protein
MMERFAARVVNEVPNIRELLKGQPYEATEFMRRIQNFRKWEGIKNDSEAQQKIREYTLGGFVLWGQFKLMDESIMKSKNEMGDKNDK